MSFEKLAQTVAATPEANQHAARRAAEDARKPFHDAWLSTIYPLWQGTLVLAARRPGIESATGGVDHRFPPAVNAAEVLKTLPARDWILAELLTVTTVTGAGVQIVYVFAGDENDGALVRLVGTCDGGDLTISPEHTKQWSGPKSKLVDAAIADAPEAAGLLGAVIFDAHQLRQERLQREEEARKEAEAKRAAAAQAEKERVEAERVRMETAALEESRRLEAEALAKKSDPPAE